MKPHALASLLSGIVVAAVACPSAPAAQTMPAAFTSTARDYAAIVAEAAQRFGIPESWIYAVMRIESAGNPRALSRVGAMGLMQLMPATWADLTARHDLGADPYDPRANVLGGAAYLQEMYRRYGDLSLALAAYNAGPGRVDDWRTSGRSLPAETRAYVARFAGAVPAIGPASAPVTVMVAARSWREAGLFARGSEAGNTKVSDAGSTADALADRQRLRLSNSLFALPSSLAQP